MYRLSHASSQPCIVVRHAVVFAGDGRFLAVGGLNRRPDPDPQANEKTCALPAARDEAKRPPCQPA